MYYNVVCTDLMIKGLVRDFVSFQKEKVFINLKKEKNNKGFVMQMRHTRLGRLILPEQVLWLFSVFLLSFLLSAELLTCSAR